MSLIKKVPLFSGKNQKLNKQKLKEIISYSLQADFGDETHKIKKIGSHIPAGIETIKGWYYGRKVPTCLYFVQLIKISPTLKQWLAIYLFGEGFWDDYMLIENIRSHKKTSVKTPSIKPENRQNFDPINDPINLNDAQKWFLIMLKSGKNIGAKDIANQFNISICTAKRYIKEMRDHYIIRFVGSNKTGRYEVCL